MWTTSWSAWGLRRPPMRLCHLTLPHANNLRKRLFRWLENIRVAEFQSDKCEGTRASRHRWMLCMAALNVGPALFSCICYLLLHLCTWVCVAGFFCADTDPSEPLSIVMWSVQVSHHSKKPPNGFLSCIVQVIFLWFIAPSILSYATYKKDFTSWFGCVALLNWCPPAFL